MKTLKKNCNFLYAPNRGKCFQRKNISQKNNFPKIILGRKPFYVETNGGLMEFMCRNSHRKKEKEVRGSRLYQEPFTIAVGQTARHPNTRPMHYL